MSLSIATWRSRYRTAELPSDEQLCAWDDAPRRLPVPDTAETEAIVCIRSLSLRTRIRGADGTARLGGVLAEALEAGIAAALLDREAPSRAGDVVVWRDRREAIADLVHRACAGDLSRAWAWRQAGLLPGGATQDAAEALDAAVALLDAEPELAWPVLARLILAEAEAGSLTVLLSALPARHWDALLPAATPDAPAAAQAAATPGDAVSAALLAWVHARPLLARQHRRALDRLIARAGSRGAAASASKLAAARLALDAIVGTAPVLERAAPHHEAATAARQVETASVAPSPRAMANAPPAPDLPPLSAPLATAWGGLLFLLPLLPATGLLDAVEEDALPVGLHAIGVALGVPPDDPVLPAFRGGAELPACDLPDQFAAIAIAVLEAALQDRLGAPDDRETWLPGLCRRDALLTIEPGWVEAEFPLSSADVRLRRGAIDLDPGHLPWLGCVVRFRYA